MKTYESLWKFQKIFTKEIINFIRHSVRLSSNRGNDLRSLVYVKFTDERSNKIPT